MLIFEVWGCAVPVVLDDQRASEKRAKRTCLEHIIQISSE